MSLRIAHLSYSSTGGGAFIACCRLNNAMRVRGVESCIVSANQLSVRPIKASLAWRIWFRFYSRKYRKQCCLEKQGYTIRGTWSNGYGLNRLDTNKEILQADVVYLHWINFDMVSIEEIGRLLDKGKPVVWFLHDMWPMTGGCHYSFDCDRYYSHCSYCPLIENSQEEDLSFKVFERKLKCLSDRHNLTIVAPSNWMANCARHSRLFGENRIKVIPNIIDSNVYRPIRKCVAREALGLPLDKKLILFGCDGGARNFYKGWDCLVAALKKMDLSNMEILIFGQGQDNEIAKMFKTDVHFLGRLNDERISLALAYNSADVFVSPSLAESFGQTLGEASACGTPCVCFNIGGCPDIVLHKKTGYLAEYKNSDDLSAGIEWVLNDADYLELSNNARSHIINLCSPEVVVKQHMKLINALV